MNNKYLKLVGFVVVSFLAGGLAMANDGATGEVSQAAAAHAIKLAAAPYNSIAAAFAIAIAAFGGALAQGKAAVAALEGIARNPAAAPKLMAPMIIALALIESLVIYAFLVSFVKILG